MASTNTNMLTNSSKQHFPTLLSKRQLKRDLRFKPVPVHSIEFGDDAVNTENFIDKVQELSQTNTVKNSGGFIVIRPTKGVEQFTKPTHSNPNDHNQSVWDALPSLTQSHASSAEIQYEKQKSGNWTFPIFTWNADHKAAIKTQFESKASHSKVLFECKRAAGELHDQMNLDHSKPSLTGHKRKNTGAIDSPQPRKKQKTEARNPSPPLLSYNTDSTNTNTSMLPSLEEDDDDVLTP
eukprot:371139_1